MKSRSSRANSGYIGQNRLSDDYGVISENKNYLRSNQTQWIRPANWLPLPSMTAGDQMFAGLLAVYPGDPALTGPTASGNFVAFSVTGCTYTVDWGNGTTQSYSAGVTAQYNYDFGSISAATTITGVEGLSGYRQTVIKAYPTVVGTTFSGLDMMGVYSQAGYTFGGGGSRIVITNWLDMRIAGSTITSFALGKNPSIGIGPYPSRRLQQFEWVGTSGITDAGFPKFSTTSYGILGGSCELKSVKGKDWLSNNTNFSYMFSGCSSLQTIPLLNTASGTIFSNMFNGCSSLQTIPLLNAASGNDFSGMFNGCSSLQTIPLLNTANGTNFSVMFYGCSSLQSIPLLNTASGNNFSVMFSSCPSLQTIPLLNTASGTNFSNMFSQCSSLQTIPLLNTAKATNIANMFSFCRNLQSIPLLNFGAATTITTPFNQCYSIKQVATSAPNATPWSLIDLNLSPAAINQVFANLPTATGSRTCNITNNWGAVGCDRTLATAKGWTTQG